MSSWPPITASTAGRWARSRLPARSRSAPPSRRRLTVRWVPYGDAGALAKAVTPDVAGVFLEPTLGESGVIPAPGGYLRAARTPRPRPAPRSCSIDPKRRRPHRRVVRLPPRTSCPMSLPSKASARPADRRVHCLASTATAFAAGDHGSTFGATPVSCAAALARAQHHRRRGHPRQRHQGRRAADGRPRAIALCCGRRGSGPVVSRPCSA